MRACGMLPASSACIIRTHGCQQVNLLVPKEATWQTRSELAAAAAADELPALQARMRCLERDVADLRASHAARSAELAQGDTDGEQAGSSDAEVWGAETQTSCMLFCSCQTSCTHLSAVVEAWCLPGSRLPLQRSAQMPCACGCATVRQRTHSCTTPLVGCWSRKLWSHDDSASSSYCTHCQSTSLTYAGWQLKRRSVRQRRGSAQRSSSKWRRPARHASSACLPRHRRDTLPSSATKQFVAVDKRALPLHLSTCRSY